MINDEMIQSAMRQGAPITCATCRWWHLGAGFCGKDACGGPSSGKDFPEYSGPIPRDRFQERCLICAAPPNYALVAIGTATRFGLCESHHDFYSRLAPPPGVVAAAPVVLKLP